MRYLKIELQRSLALAHPLLSMHAPDRDTSGPVTKPSLKDWMGDLEVCWSMYSPGAELIKQALSL